MLVECDKVEDKEDETVFATVVGEGKLIEAASHQHVAIGGIV